MNLHANDLSHFEERLGEEGTATEYFAGMQNAGLFGMNQEKGLGIAAEYAECQDEDCDLDHDRLGAHTDGGKAQAETPWPLPEGGATAAAAVAPRPPRSTRKGKAATRHDLRVNSVGL